MELFADQLRAVYLKTVPGFTFSHLPKMKNSEVRKF